MFKKSEIALRTSKMYVHGQALYANPCYIVKTSRDR